MTAEYRQQQRESAKRQGIGSDFRQNTFSRVNRALRALERAETQHEWFRFYETMHPLAQFLKLEEVLALFENVYAKGNQPTFDDVQHHRKRLEEILTELRQEYAPRARRG